MLSQIREFLLGFFPLEKLKKKKKKEKKLKVQLADFLFLCCLREKVLFGLAVPFQPLQTPPDPKPHQHSALSQVLDSSESLCLPQLQACTFPHRPLDSPYVLRSMETIFSSHVTLVSFRMLYQTMPGGRTSSLRQNK